MAGAAGGVKSALADPLAVATKPAVIFKFAAAVSTVQVKAVHRLV